MKPINRIAQIVGTGFFVGYFPIFPATIGSLLGLGVYFLLVSQVGALSVFGIPWIILLCCVFVLGVWAAHSCEKIYGVDDRHIVIDEIWGMLIGLQGLKPSPTLLLAFMIFRAIDIVKPFPIRRVEKIAGGLGVVLDDGIAGVYTALVILLVRGLMRS